MILYEVKSIPLAFGYWYVAITFVLGSTSPSTVTMVTDSATVRERGCISCYWTQVVQVEQYLWQSLQHVQDATSMLLVLTAM